MVRQVKQYLHGLPKEGLTYGIGKWMRDDGAELVGAPQVSLNNWGGQSQSGSLFRTSRHSFEDELAVRDFKRNHLIDLVITTGTGFGMHWIYSRSLHRKETIAALARNYVAHLRLLAGTTAAG
jgi:non-ribosomal peptide synthase protein (TIGR01720 family)